MTKKRPSKDVQIAALVNAVKGLLKVAKIAMPDTYWATDSRIRRAKRALSMTKARKP